MSKKIITINDKDVVFVKLDLWQYRGNFLAWVQELPDGSDEMRFCDENGNVFPDSPVVICLPEKRE